MGKKSHQHPRESGITTSEPHPIPFSLPDPAGVWFPYCLFFRVILLLLLMYPWPMYHMVLCALNLDISGNIYLYPLISCFFPPSIMSSRFNHMICPDLVYSFRSQENARLPVTLPTCCSQHAAEHGRGTNASPCCQVRDSANGQMTA